MSEIKVKATNEQARKTKKFMDTDNSTVVTRRRRGGEVVKSKGGQVYGAIKEGFQDCLKIRGGEGGWLNFHFLCGKYKRCLGILALGKYHNESQEEFIPQREVSNLKEI